VTALIAASAAVLAAPSLIQIDNPSPAADAAFGTGVAAIGDVNRDGIAS
jgi:hypothetical protein